MLKQYALSAVVALSLVPGTASAWIAGNGLVVTPTGQSTFEVPYRGRSGVRDFWCAAGDYVRYELGLPGNTRIFRTTPPPRAKGTGIQFSLSPDGATASGLAIIGGSKGIRALHATSLCPNSRGRF